MVPSKMHSGTYVYLSITCVCMGPESELVNFRHKQICCGGCLLEENNMLGGGLCLLVKHYVFTYIVANYVLNVPV